MSGDVIKIIIIINSCINALFLVENIKPVWNTINMFQLAVENSRNNDFFYCIMLGLYMANWNWV